MRLTRIEIKSFGKFHDRQFDLSKPLTVFFGLNEAGKSTLVSFISQIVFGFATKKNNKNNYQPKNPPESFGGSLTFIQDQSTWKLERILGTGLKTGTLTVWLNNEIAPAESFFNQIKNINQKFFEESFLYNQETLARILTLSEQELINQINYLGASNSAKWMDLSKELSKDSDKLFKPSKTAKNPLVNQKINELKVLESKLTEKNREYQTYQENARRLQPHVDKITELERQNIELNKDANKLSQRLKEVQIFKHYEETKNQIESELIFDENEFREANLISTQIGNLSRHVVEVKEQLNKDVTSEQLDVEYAKELIEKWSDIDRLDSRIFEQTNQIEELENDQNRIRNYQKDTVKFADFSEVERQQFINDFKIYQDEVKKDSQIPTKEEKFDVHLLIQVLGALISAVGVLLILFKPDKTTGILFATIGGALATLPLVLNKQSSKKSSDSKDNLTIGNINPEQKFKNKYDIDPPIDLSEFLIRTDKFKEVEDKIFNLRLKLEEEKTEFNKFAAELGISTENEFSSIIREIQQKINDLKQRIDEQLKKDTHNEILQKELVQLTTDLQTQRQKLEILFLQNKVKNLDEFKEKSDLFSEQKNLKNKLQIYRENLGENFAFFKNNKFDEDNLNKQIAKINQQQNEVQTDLHQEQQTIADLNSQQQMLANDSDVLELQQEISDLKDEIKILVNHWLIKKMGSAWIDDMLNLASSNRFPKMKQAAQEYFALLSGNRYQQINLADKNISVVRTENKEKFIVDQLSRGTAEQLYFALKLAFVEQIADEISLPILIDDAFVNFDGQRVQYMKELLDKLASKNQVLVFTARDDLAKLFTETDNLIRL